MHFYRTTFKLGDITKGIRYLVHLFFQMYKLETELLHLLDPPCLPMRQMQRGILEEVT